MQYSKHMAYEDFISECLDGKTRSFKYNEEGLCFYGATGSGWRQVYSYIPIFKTFEDNRFVTSFSSKEDLYGIFCYLDRYRINQVDQDFLYQKSEWFDIDQTSSLYQVSIWDEFIGSCDTKQNALLLAQNAIQLLYHKCPYPIEYDKQEGLVSISNQKFSWEVNPYSKACILGIKEGWVKPKL